MYQIAICDDRREDRAQLSALTRQVLRDKHIEAELTLYATAAALLQDMQGGHAPYDLYLLDILMGDENGVDLARTLRQMRDPGRLVFVTSSRDYAVEGFELGADNYLLKPVTAEKLGRALSRLLKSRNTVMFYSESGSLLPLSADSILWAEAFSHSIQLHTATKAVTVRGPLEDVRQKLEQYGFVRCHRSYLVNLAYISEIGRREALLIDGTQIPISRGNFQMLQEALLRYTESNIDFDPF